MDVSSQIGGPADPGGPPAPYPPAGRSQPQTSTNAIIALGFAIASYIVLPFIGAIVALILARNADEEIAVSGGRVTGAGLAHAARVAAWVNVIFSAVVAVAALLVVLLVFGTL